MGDVDSTPYSTYSLVRPYGTTTGVICRGFKQSNIFSTSWDAGEKKTKVCLLILGVILLMAEILHQLRLVASPIICRVFTYQVVSRISAINSTTPGDINWFRKDVVHLMDIWWG